MRPELLPRGRRRQKSCWLAQFSEVPCDGKLRKCHLIPAQTIKREVGKKHAWDERAVVWGCGGAMGVSGHHGMLDSSRTLRVPRACLPPDLEVFAVEMGLVWWLDRTYGLLSV